MLQFGTKILIPAPEVNLFATNDDYSYPMSEVHRVLSIAIASQHLTLAILISQ